MTRSMRLLTFILTLGFSITLADANQQVLMQVQWQQLSLQADLINNEEKLQRVQDLSAFISLDTQTSTKLAKSPHQVFKTGSANQAELAFSKWLMYTKLGFAPEDFRLIYLQRPKGQATQVWLAYYDGQDAKLITSNQIVDRSRLNSILTASRMEIVSVVDPNQVLHSRLDKRQFAGQSQGMSYL